MEPQQYFCPTELALEILSGKWKSAILWILSYGPRKFSELESLLNGVPKQSLSDRLRELECDRIIERHRYQERPERFQYGLSEKGLELWGITKQLCEWGQKQRPGEVFPSAECIKTLTANQS